MLVLSAIGFMRSHPRHLGDTFAALALVPTENPLLAVSWTLVYELYFYVLFAGTLALRSRTASVIVTTLAIAVVFLIANARPAGDAAGFLARLMPLEFCFGLWLAWLRTRPRWPYWAGAAALIVICAAPAFAAHSNTNGLVGLVRIAAWGLPSLLITALALRVRRPVSLPGRFAEQLGNASYSLYLTHPFVVLGYGLLLRETSLGTIGQLPVVILVVGTAIVLALAAHRFVERPLTAAIGRHVSRSRDRGLPAGGSAAVP